MKEKNINYQNIKLVTLVKVRHADDVTHTDALKNPGFEIEGVFNGPPMVGERFWVGASFSTAEVTELLPNSRFSTETCIWEYSVREVPASKGKHYVAGNSTN